MHRLPSLLVVSLLLLHIIPDGCHGNFQYDFFSILGLNPYDLDVAGIESVDGPPSKKGSKGIKFTENAGKIELHDEEFAYMANSLQTSKDITFAVYFNIMATKKKERSYSPFFALSNTLLTNNFFSIGLESQQSFVIVEGKKRFNDKVDWSVAIEQWVKDSKQSEKTSFDLGDHLKFQQWMLLMVRIRGSKVTISLDCKPVAEGNLVQGPIGEFSYEGNLTFSQFLSEEFKKQFVGSMYEPQLIDGKLAFDWYSPCDADFTPSEVLPEPKAKDYNPDKFDEFQKMSLQERKKVKIFCIDSTGVKHYNNGNFWKKNCDKWRCENGVIKHWYICPYCRHEGKQYMADQTWIDKNDVCMQHKCRSYNFKVKTTQIECKPLACPKDEQYQPTGECCPKCKADDCPADQQYYNGCERFCRLGIDQKCETETKGCYCPEGEALNEKGKCVPTAECKCIVPGRQYLPGQAVKQSLCKTCICSHGTFSCFTTC